MKTRRKGGNQLGMALSTHRLKKRAWAGCFPRLQMAIDSKFYGTPRYPFLLNSGRGHKRIDL